MDTKRIDEAFDKLRETETVKWAEFNKQQNAEFAKFVESCLKG